MDLLVSFRPQGRSYGELHRLADPVGLGQN